jgi:hypothetical protein
MILTLPQTLAHLAQKDSLLLELAEKSELIAQKDAQIQELIRKNESLQRQLTTLQHQMEQMLRRLYGRKSEQLNPNQMMLDSIILESLEQNAPQMPFAADIPIQAEGLPRDGRIPEGDLRRSL